MRQRAGRAGRAGRVAALAAALLAVAPVSATASDFPVPGAAAMGTAAPQVAGAGTAAIGAFDCDRLRVELRLDNRRSTREARYRFEATFVRPLHPPHQGADRRVEVEVAAGASRVVALPVRDDARTAVTVTLPDGGHVYSQGSCGSAPAASFGPSDCDAGRLGLTLDNSTSRLATRYRWVLADAAGPVASETLEVDAGDVAAVELPLVRGSWTDVQVAVAGGGEVATSGRQGCGRVVLDPRASFGEVDCADVSAPVILDNSRSTARLPFHLPGRVVVLAAGETRALRLHLPIRDRLAVRVDDLPADVRPARAVTSTARCAAAPSGPSSADPIGAGSTGAEPPAEPVAGALGAGQRAGAVAAAPSAVEGEDRSAAGSSRWPVIGASLLLLSVGAALLAGVRRYRRTD